MISHAGNDSILETGPVDAAEIILRSNHHGRFQLFHTDPTKEARKVSSSPTGLDK